MLDLHLEHASDVAERAEGTVELDEVSSWWAPQSPPSWKRACNAFDSLTWERWKHRTMVRLAMPTDSPERSHASPYVARVKKGRRWRAKR